MTAQCVYCNLDGWKQTPVSPQAKLQASLEGPSSLMECSVCYEISHPDCAQRSTQTASGVVNEDLPNSWECPKCCDAGKNNDYKVKTISVTETYNSIVYFQPRHFRARQKSSEIRRMSVNSDASSILDNKASPIGGDGGIGMSSDSEIDSKANIRKLLVTSPLPSTNLVKVEVKQENFSPTPLETPVLEAHSTIKRRKSEEGSMCSSIHESVEIIESNVSRKKSTLRTQLAQQIIGSTNKVLKKPSYVVRPGNVSMSTNSQSANYALDPTCMLVVFRYLPSETLVTCSMVCKTWSTLSVDPILWKRMNCSHHKLSSSLLAAIVRRQPEHLILDWTILAKRQLAWVIARTPAMKTLSMQGIPIGAVLGLHTCLCPPLQSLDLSFVRGLNDSAIRDILSPPKDSRPGLSDSKSRLRNLKVLKVAGTDISDVALRYITQGVPSLTQLDLSSCQRITDAGVAQIGTCPSAINTLVELDLSSCKLVTESCLEYLSKCEALTWLDLRHVPQVSTQILIKFAAKSKHNLQVKDVKLVDKRSIINTQ